MTWVGWAVLCVVAVAQPGWAEVWVGGELGWQGQAVLGAVNPLTITVTNGTSSVLSATLRVEQRVGSGWRGEGMQRLRAPLLLAPGGRAQFAFPWPVEAGSAPAVVVEADGTELARATLPLRLMAEKPIATVGSVAAYPDGGPTIALAPEDLPEDPFLFSPFSEVRLTRGAVVSAPVAEALAAWVAFGGGLVRNGETPTVIPSLSAMDLDDAVARHGPRPPPRGLLIGGTVLYLIALGLALPPLSRRGRPWGIAALISAALTFALFYPVFFGSPQTTTLILYSLSTRDVSRFSADTLVVVPVRGGIQEVSGWWVERVSPGSERSGMDIEWVWGAEGPRTLVAMNPGKTLVLWGYGRAWSTGGTRHVVGSVAVDAGFAPLLAAVGPVAREGDLVYTERIAERQGGVARYEYRLRWEPDG
ncbi:MAG TPA: hypothetical protein PLC08_03010 [Candidatus Bipolaricaulis sp.]|nr:hypothetical protein [Candidatus Bipolaricaulis sp.]HRS13828.1 hypothetical protein [Candidatus Bipolaricaulis sp.]HRU21464.1 hypothetical protein [Candidatus Bipolaricaulis sp.]